MTALGEDVIISIGGTDYSVYIDSYSESGGEKQIKTIRTFGQNYEDIVVGREDYNIEFEFRIESTTINTLFENLTPITISIIIGSEQTITFTNMIPSSLNIKLETDDICLATIGYKAPAYNKSGTHYNRVIS